MATDIRRDERDINFLVLCQNKQNRKVLTNSVTVLSTMFKVVAEKNTELQKKNNLSSIWSTYVILVLNTVIIATTISFCHTYFSAILFYMFIKINQ